MKKAKRVIFAVLCAFLASRAIAQQMTLSHIRQLPQKKTVFYDSAFSPNVADTLQTASPAVIRYLCDMDKVTNYSNHELTQGERDLFLEYYSFLPKEFRDLISRKVLAIYVIDGFPFGGMADYFTPIEKYRNRDVRKINFWGFGKTTRIETAGKLIDYLSKSPFSSLYGAMNWADDYAETFTYRYLEDTFDIAYTVRYEENGVTMKSYTPTDNPLVTERYSSLAFAE